MTTTVIDTRLVDYLMAAIIVVGSIFAVMLGFTVMNMVYGYLIIPYDPDFLLLYKNNTAAWAEELDYYGERLNQTMYPLCCHQFGEGEVWGDTRK